MGINHHQNENEETKSYIENLLNQQQNVLINYKRN